MMRGFVSLVGAEPGDLKLITAKGLRRLRAAEVVAYDALVNDVLLAECREDADIIPVGKRAGQPSKSQEVINVHSIFYGSTDAMHAKSTQSKMHCGA